MHEIPSKLAPYRNDNWRIIQDTFLTGSTLHALEFLLCDCKANPNIQNLDHKNAFEISCDLGNIQVASTIILSEKLDPKQTYQNGMTALHLLINCFGKYVNNLNKE